MERPLVLYSGPAEALDALEERLTPAFRVERTEPDAGLLARFEACTVFLDASMKVRIPAESIVRASRLKLVVTATTGADHIDARALEARGIPLLTLKGQTAFLSGFTGAAEHSWLLLLACARRLRAATAHVSAGKWERTAFPGIMVKGKVLGLVGFGRLGTWMSRYALAFGMRVCATDPHVTAFPSGVTALPLDELLRVSDFVSIHVHLAPETKGLIGEKEFHALKRGAILVNTSRGEIIDEHAAVAALADGRLAALGADVLTGEPQIEQGPLWRYAQTHDNVLITPHIGGFCPETVQQAVAFSADRIRSHFAA